jgi:hypothetical protein
VYEAAIDVVMPDAGLDLVCAEFDAAHAERLACARTTSRCRNVSTQSGDYPISNSGINLSADATAEALWAVRNGATLLADIRACSRGFRDCIGFGGLVLEKT